MKHLLAITLLCITGISNAQVLSGSAAGINLGVNYALRYNLYIGVSASKDYTMSKIQSYSATNIYLIIGYGDTEKRQYVSGGLTFGKCFIPVSQNINGENINIPAGLNSTNSDHCTRLKTITNFIGLQVNYNYKIRKGIAAYAGLEVRHRREDYEFMYLKQGSATVHKELVFNKYFLPTLNLGINFLL